jgi:[acyl-carrier-protein] S-malonyltransferase
MVLTGYPMRLALLFSGQGDQQPSHFERLQIEATPEISAVLARVIPQAWSADKISIAELQVNRIAQPFIFAHQTNLWTQLPAALSAPVCVAGYSVGEVAACCAAGCFSFEQGIDLAAQRAAYMDACVSSQSGMLAVRGLTAEACEAIALRCGVEISIRNATAHFVFGGDASKLEEAAHVAESMGAARVRTLGVTTPSHTSYLADARARFSKRLEPFRTGPLRVPVVSAVDGKISRTAAEAADRLAMQISTRMDWAACLDAVLEMQPEMVLEIGPGRALARMWDERQTGIPARAADDFRSVQGILEWLLRQA